MSARALEKVAARHCVRSAGIRSYSGPHFPPLGTEYGDILRFSLYSVRMLENAGQNNSEYGHFLRSEKSFRWYEIGTYDLVNIEVQIMFQAFLLLQNTGVYLQFYSLLS